MPIICSQTAPLRLYSVLCGTPTFWMLEDNMVKVPHLQVVVFNISHKCHTFKIPSSVCSRLKVPLLSNLLKFSIWVLRNWVLPIWPSLHFGCATTLPPIQKNSSASLDMDAFCQSFGELIMDALGEFTGLEACFTWWEEPLASEGENIPGDKDPRDWKVVFLGDMEESVGLPLSPGDRGAIAGLMFIPESYIWVHLSRPIHGTWTHRPPHSAGLFSQVSLTGGAFHAASKVSAYPPLPGKIFTHGIS